MTKNPLLDKLRYHVSGAVERGEAEAIIEIPADGGGAVFYYIVETDGDGARFETEAAARAEYDRRAALGEDVDLWRYQVDDDEDGDLLLSADCGCAAEPEKCTAHTPGEWHGVPAAGNGQGLIYSLETGANVAVAYDLRDTALIAAAPELLSALEAVLPAFDTMLCWMWKDMPEADRDTRHAALKAAEAAIARARGL